MKKTAIISIIISALFLIIFIFNNAEIILSNLPGTILFSAYSGFFKEIMTFILAGLLLFYIIKIIESIYQYFTELIIFHKKNTAKHNKI
jgi:uncharacterized membrane protein